MHTALRAFSKAMEAERNNSDPGSDWHSLDDVSALINARTDVYSKHNFSIEARAAFETSLLWAMNANANPLIFWMLNHIYADEDLLAKLREEVAPYVRAVQPKQTFGIAEAPQMQSVDQDGLLANCPLLKSAYIETLRVDTSIWSLKVMKEDLVLAGRDKRADKFLLKKGTYTHVAHDMHHKDPDYFDDPTTWRADRHIVYVEDKAGGKWVSVDMGTIRPFGEYKVPNVSLSQQDANESCRWRSQHVQRARLCAKGSLGLHCGDHQLLGHRTRWRWTVEDA